jgi:hypothetical protein
MYFCQDDASYPSPETALVEIGLNKTNDIIRLLQVLPLPASRSNQLNYSVYWISVFSISLRIEFNSIY